jgi:hypothetical protein
VSTNLDFVRDLFGSKELIELARRGEAPIDAMYTEDAVVDNTNFEVPGLAGMYRGAEEIRRFWMDWYGAWSDLQWKADFYERESVVLADVRELVAVGSKSGVRVEQPHAQTLRFRGNRVDLHVIYPDRAQGFAAAGIVVPD